MRTSAILNELYRSAGHFSPPMLGRMKQTHLSRAARWPFLNRLAVLNLACLDPVSIRIEDVHFPPYSIAHSLVPMAPNVQRLPAPALAGVPEGKGAKHPKRQPAC